MKKLLSLILVLTGMVSTASAEGVTSDVYLVGGFNSWNTSANKFTKLNDYEFTITLTGDVFTAYKANNYFKLYVADWDNKYVGPWNDSENNIGTTKQVSSNTSAGESSNFYIETISEDAFGLQIYLKWTEVSSGNWQFEITAANLTKEYTIALVNSADWSNIKLYSWEGDHKFLYAWPGETLTENNGVYTKTFYANSSAKVIYNDGTNQTQDLDITENGVYENNTINSFVGSVVGNINVKAGTTGIATFSSAYPLDFSSTSSISAYTVSALSKTSATLTKVQQAVPAQTGLIIMGDANANEDISPIATTSSVGDNYLKATVTATEVSADQAYILYNGQFHPANAGMIPAGKAYLLKTDVPKEARALSLVFDNESTGINEVKATTAKADGCYNLAGQRVTAPNKGLYIMNGKKVIVK